MEGFYVPESAFRDFMKDAGSNTVQQNISFESTDGYGTGISTEAIAEHVQLCYLCNIFQYQKEQGENQVQYHCLPDKLGGCKIIYLNTAKKIIVTF